MPDLHQPAHPVRFVTAASLFDGHDAAINIMRRILQRQGAEVIHLGPQPLGRGGRRRRDPGGRAGRRGQLVPGRPRRVLQLPRRAAARARRRARQGLRRRRRRDRARGDRAAARARRARIFSPEDGQRLGLRRDDQPDDRASATSTSPPSRPASLDGCSPATGRRWPARSPAPRPGGSPTSVARPATAARRRRCRCSASPAPAAPASRR